MLIKLPIKSDVPIVAPADLCCNCGSAENLTPQITDLRRMPFMGLAGVEVKLPLPFPYCQACSVTSRRKRLGVLGMLAVFAFSLVVLTMGWLFLGPQLSESLTKYVIGPLAVIISISIVIGIYAFRRPKGRQTSYYQPVILKNTGHKWPMDITGLELAFTNEVYAQQFSKANEPSISAKKLKVAVA